MAISAAAAEANRINSATSSGKNGYSSKPTPSVNTPRAYTPSSSSGSYRSTPTISTPAAYSSGTPSSSASSGVSYGMPTPPASTSQKYDPFATVYTGKDQYGDYRINAAHAIMRDNYGGSFGGVNEGNKAYVQDQINKNDSSLLSNFAKDNPSWWSSSNMPMSASQVASSGTGMPSAVNYPGMNSNAGSVNAPPPPQSNQSQQSARDWINNPASGQGGYDNYIKGQQSKYDSAYASGNQNILNALKADMARVGYTLNEPSVQSGTTSNPTGVGLGQTPNTGSIPATSTNIYGLDDAKFKSIQDQATAQSAAEIAAQSTIANQQKSSLQQSADRMKSQETDNRNLENFANDQSLNPFNGYSDYAKGQIARERAITDRQGQQDLQSKLSNIDAQLADFSRASAAKKQEIVNNMAKELADYKLKEQAQQNQNDLTKNTIDNTAFNQQQDVKKQHIDLANFLTQQYGVTVYPTDDPMLAYAQVAGIPTTAAQKIAMDAQQMSFDNAVKKALAENTINKTEADIMQGARQLAISQQNANTSASSAANSNANADARLKFDKEQAANKPKSNDAYKTDPSFATDLAHMKSNPADAAKLDTDSQAFIQAYGYDGYLALRKAAGLQDPIAP